MDFILEFEQETDDRWIAEILELPGVLAYGLTRMQAGEKAKALALRVLAGQSKGNPAARIKPWSGTTGRIMYSPFMTAKK